MSDYTEQARQLVESVFVSGEHLLGKEELVKRIASFAAEAATQGQVVGIERVAQVLDALAKKNEDEFNAPPSAANAFSPVMIDTPAGYSIWHDMNQFKKLAAEVRTLSPDASYLDRVRNEARAEFEAEVRSLKQQNRELKSIIDVATDDDPGTALSKLHKIQHEAATAALEQAARAVQLERAEWEAMDTPNARRVIALEVCESIERRIAAIGDDKDEHGNRD